MIPTLLISYEHNRDSASASLANRPLSLRVHPDLSAIPGPYCVVRICPFPTPFACGTDLAANDLRAVAHTGLRRLSIQGDTNVDQSLIQSESLNVIA